MNQNPNIEFHILKSSNMILVGWVVHYSHQWIPLDISSLTSNHVDAVGADISTVLSGALLFSCKFNGRQQSDSAKLNLTPYN